MPQWFEEKLQEVEAADQHFRRLHALVESLVVHRKGQWSPFHQRLGGCDTFLAKPANVTFPGGGFPLRFSPPTPFAPGACAADLSSNTASFAKSVAMLGSAEDNTALSRALSQLAEVEDKMEQLHQDQAANDTFSFAEVIADYIRLLGAVRVRRGDETSALRSVVGPFGFFCKMVKANS